jgi:hypothetical protein
MISLKKNKSNKTKAYEKLLSVLLGEEEYHNGSYFENTNIAHLIEIVNKVLFADKNNSVHLIIDKKGNHSMDITIDLVK